MLGLLSFSDYQIPLQREEIETVTKLRDEWANLVLLGDQVIRLTHIHYPWKQQKIRGLLLLSGGIERDQWYEMG